MNFEALRELKRNALLYIHEHGTEVQKIDIDGLIPQLSKCAEELEDLTTGKRDPEKHPHHRPEDLQESVNLGRRQIGRLCRDVVANNKPS